ncbi:hypothetical protein LCGC14_2991560 [marine sediment metagenome]|uniref:Uncharacterized protein n=1 Tax=marine sediment metagenome TaxID=412755 RepID=A0A0F8ZUQ5_9ZZZZ
MSMLCWKPEPDGNEIVSENLRIVLRRRMGEQESIILNSADLQWVEGIVDVFDTFTASFSTRDAEAARRLICGIKQYGRITIKGV